MPIYMYKHLWCAMVKNSLGKAASSNTMPRGSVRFFEGAFYVIRHIFLKAEFLHGNRAWFKSRCSHVIMHVLGIDTRLMTRSINHNDDLKSQTSQKEGERKGGEISGTANHKCVSESYPDNDIGMLFGVNAPWHALKMCTVARDKACGYSGDGLWLNEMCARPC